MDSLIIVACFLTLLLPFFFIYVNKDLHRQRGNFFSSLTPLGVEWKIPTQERQERGVTYRTGSVGGLPIDIGWMGYSENAVGPFIQVSTPSSTWAPFLAYAKKEIKFFAKPPPDYTLLPLFSTLRGTRKSGDEDFDNQVEILIDSDMAKRHILGNDEILTSLVDLVSDDTFISAFHDGKRLTIRLLFGFSVSKEPIRFGGVPVAKTKEINPPDEKFISIIKKMGALATQLAQTPVALDAPPKPLVIKQKLFPFLFYLFGIGAVSVFLFYMNTAIYQKVIGFGTELFFPMLLISMPASIVAGYYLLIKPEQGKLSILTNGYPMFMLTIILIPFLLASLPLSINWAFDSSPIEERIVTVRSVEYKKYSGKSSRYITVDSWRNDSETIELPCSFANNAHCKPGAEFRIRYHSGFLGYEWHKASEHDWLTPK